MVFPYPEFHGRTDESVEEFLEKMEVACISNHIQEPAISWDNLQEAVAEEFERKKDPDKVWHEVQELNQRDNEPMESYIKKFAMSWESLCKAL